MDTFQFQDSMMLRMNEPNLISGTTREQEESDQSLNYLT